MYLHLYIRMNEVFCQRAESVSRVVQRNRKREIYVCQLKDTS